MAKGDNLGEFEILVLVTLLRLGKRAYGVNVRREIEERGGRRVSIGAVYATLSRLEQKGYVRSWLGAPTAERGGRAKRHFDLSSAGSKALDRALRPLSRLCSGLNLEWGLQ